jgi:E3 ubiquitin-protein ligase UBR2
MEDDAEKLVVRVIKHDAKLWKAARAAWHNLFISTMLMNFERKREFAVVFADNYINILDDFVDDDQVHQASIISFSVQLFTVPSVAHHLIEDYGILSKLFTTFITGCDPSQGNGGNQHNTAQNARNKRSGAVFLDLGYLLSVPPDTWNQRLRCGFLYGFGRLLAVLNQLTVSNSSRNLNTLFVVVYCCRLPLYL